MAVFRIFCDISVARSLVSHWEAWAPKYSFKYMEMV